MRMSWRPIVMALLLTAATALLISALTMCAVLADARTPGPVIVVTPSPYGPPPPGWPPPG